MDEKIFKISVDTYPEYNISACLMVNVTNGEEVLKKLIGGELNCALMNTIYIPNIFPVLMASNKAVHLFEHSHMKTRNLHTEILFNLFPTNSINSALKTFGIKGKEESLLLVSVSKNDSDIQKAAESVRGDLVDLSDLDKFCSLEQIQKLYNITKEELEIGTYSDAITLRVATKDAL